MSLHVFGAILTTHGCAANNRGETEGNITTLQKLLWKGQVHTTVSSEAIRWALRYYRQKSSQDHELNRVWIDTENDHSFRDLNYEAWHPTNLKVAPFWDDDVLGFMDASASSEESELQHEIPKRLNELTKEVEKKPQDEKLKKKKKGGAIIRRGVLEIARAISTLPFVGDITFNAKSGEKGRTSLYGTEMHATRYQYGFAMTPERLRVKNRCLDVLDAITGLGEVAGNHSRFLFDFSPESIIIRVTHDPAPRILYCFKESDNEISTPELIRKIDAQDIKKEEFFIGGAISDFSDLKTKFNGQVFGGVKEATEKAKLKILEELITTANNDEKKLLKEIKLNIQPQKID